jgi:hypothetical protein
VNKATIYLFLITLLGVFISGTLKSQDTLHYIFLGHIKKPIAGIYIVDERIEGLDYNVYDRIWLGGDITGESSLNFETLEYLDNLFDLSNPSNHWAFGNHDLRNFNDEWLLQITGRKTYYTYYENGITTIVLNLAIGPDDCEKLDEQFRMIENVVDTIEESSHLILISHHNVWRNVPGLPPPGGYSHSNQITWIANCYDQDASFVDAVYPLLLQIKEKNITVINILGDAGSSDKGISMVSNDGIYFIASGINPLTQEDRGPDKVLIFDHIPETSELNWRFHKLDSLYNSFQ